MNWSDSQTELESRRQFLCFVLSTVIAENAVSQRYVVEKTKKKSHSYFMWIWIFIFHSYTEFRITHRIKCTYQSIVRWYFNMLKGFLMGEGCFFVFNKRVHNPLILPPGILMFGIILFKRQQHFQVSCSDIWNWILWIEIICLHNITWERLKHSIVSFCSHITQEFEFLFEGFDLAPDINYCCIWTFKF